jgi:hypothetical protein
MVYVYRQHGRETLTDHLTVDEEATGVWIHGTIRHAGHAIPVDEHVAWPPWPAAVDPSIILAWDIVWHPSLGLRWAWATGAPPGGWPRGTVGIVGGFKPGPRCTIPCDETLWHCVLEAPVPGQPLHPPHGIRSNGQFEEHHPTGRRILRPATVRQPWDEDGVAPGTDGVPTPNVPPDQTVPVTS